MSQYKYVTILEAQSDGKPPNDGIEEGDKILKAGKHDTDAIEYMTEDGGLDSVGFTQVELYEAPRKMSKQEIEEYGKEEWFA